MRLSEAGRCPKSRGGHHRWIDRTVERNARIRHFICFGCNREAWHWRLYREDNEAAERSLQEGPADPCHGNRKPRTDLQARKV